MIELFRLEPRTMMIYDHPKRMNESYWNIPVRDSVPILNTKFQAISSVGDPRHKRLLLNELERLAPLEYVNMIHLSCVILPSAKIGKGVYMQPQNIVYANTKIGDHVSMCGACNIGHDSTVDDHCTLAPRVIICGNVTIEKGVFLGVGATVLPGRKIGQGAEIGAGAIILEDVPANEVWAGVPAKRIGMKEPW